MPPTGYSPDFDVVFGNTVLERKLVPADRLRDAAASRGDSPHALHELLVERGDLSQADCDTILSLFDHDLAPDAIPGYEILSAIGRGAMGTVVKARAADGTTVALKILAPAWARDRAMAARFLREADALRRLDHHGVVRLLASGQSGGYTWLAMEFVDGPSLHEKLRESGPLSEAEALDLAEQLADALAHAHALGIVHRDVKPANVLLSPSGPKLADFGLARDLLQPALTASVAFLGTPHYCSPEQAHGARDADARTDWYSLGATLYHAATGRLPFEGESAIAVVVKHVSRPLKPPRQVRPELSASFDALIRKLMAKDPDERPRDAKELAADLAGVRGGRSPKRRRRMSPLQKRQLIVALVFILPMPLALGIWWMLQPSPPPPAAVVTTLDDGRVQVAYAFDRPEELADWVAARPGEMPERPTMVDGAVLPAPGSSYWQRREWTGDLDVDIEAAGDPSVGVVVQIGALLFKVVVGGRAQLFQGGRPSGEAVEVPAWTTGAPIRLRIVKRARSLEVFAGTQRVAAARLGANADGEDRVTFGIVGPPAGVESDCRYGSVVLVGRPHPAGR